MYLKIFNWALSFVDCKRGMSKRGKGWRGKEPTVENMRLVFVSHAGKTIWACLNKHNVADSITMV